MRTIAVLFFFLSFWIACGPGFAAKESLRAKESLEKRQKVEMMSFFMKDPGQAQLPQTTLAIELFNQAVEFYEKREYNLAKEALEDSLKYDDQNALAYELLGEIAYYQQKLKRARTYYKKAYELQPRKALKKKISKLKQETSVEKKLSTYKERHFIIKYQRGNQQYDGFELRELLRQKYRDISKQFGYYLKHQVIVLLYDQQAFEELTSLPHWAAGVYDGKIRMPAYRKGFKAAELEALTMHELTHAFIATISKNRAPAWINEGMAEVMEQKVTRDKRQVLRAAIRSGTLLSLDELMATGSTSTLNDPVKVSLFYDQAYSLTAYMVKRYGMFRIKKVLEQFAKGKNSDEAIRRILKVTPQKLEREWLHSLKK